MLALLAFTGLMLAVTWPMARNYFTVVNDRGDMRQMVWQLWHASLALQGQEPFLATQLLYYPHDATLIAIPIYPLIGGFAYPFWSLGIPAAYNTTVLITFALSGWCIYLLGRSLGLNRLAALLAGVIAIMTPIHMAAAVSHLTKAFIGGDGAAARSRARTARDRRANPATLVVVSWYFPMVWQISKDPAIEENVSGETVNYQPDLVEFLIPAPYNRSAALVQGLVQR